MLHSYCAEYGDQLPESCSYTLMKKEYSHTNYRARIWLTTFNRKSITIEELLISPSVAPPSLLTTFHSLFSTSLSLSQLSIDLNAFASHLSVSPLPHGVNTVAALSGLKEPFTQGCLPCTQHNTAHDTHSHACPRAATPNTRQCAHHLILQ